jgi:hypothetical protein
MANNEKHLFNEAKVACLVVIALAERDGESSLPAADIIVLSGLSRGYVLHRLSYWVLRYGLLCRTFKLDRFSRGRLHYYLSKRGKMYLKRRSTDLKRRVLDSLPIATRVKFHLE